MVQHLNFGRKGGVGLYTITDPQGKPTPLRWQYDTRKGGINGFFIQHVGVESEACGTWAELREAWVKFVAELGGSKPA